MATVATQDALSGGVAALTLFAAEYLDVELMSALLNQDYAPDGRLSKVVEIGFRLRGRPGSLGTSVPFSSDWLAVAEGAVAREAWQVRLIYEGAADNSSVFSNPPLDVLPGPGERLPV